MEFEVSPFLSFSIVLRHNPVTLCVREILIWIV